MAEPNSNDMDYGFSPVGDGANTTDSVGGRPYYDSDGDPAKDILDTPNKPPEEGDGVDALQNLENEISDENSLPSAFALKLEEGEDLYATLNTISSDLMSDFNTRHTWRYPYEYGRWYQEYRQFFNDQLLTSTPTRSKVYVPIINEIIRVATSKLVGFVTSADDIFDVSAKSPLEQNIAENIKLLVGDQLEQNQFGKKFEDFIMNLLMYGTAYIVVDWEEKWAHVYEDVEKVEVTLDPILGIPVPKVTLVPTKKYKCVANRPNIRVVDILDVYPAQNYAEVEDQPGVFIRNWMNVKEFRDKLQDSDYFGNNAAAMALEGSDQYQFTRQWRKISRGEMSTIKFDQIELLEYWGPYDLDGDGIREECQIVIANRELVVRAVPNPFHHQKRPIVKCVCNNVAGEWYGQSLIEPVLQMQEELNTIRRQSLDAASLSVNRMFKVKITSGIEESQLVNREGGIIYVDNMDDMAILDPIVVPPDAFANAGQIANDMFDATIPKTLTGTVEDIKGGNSIGGVKMNEGQALERFATIAQNIQSSAIEPMLQMMYQLDLQFLNSSEIIRAFYGNIFSNPALVTPAMIRGQVEFSMKSLSEMVNRDSKVQQLIAMYQVFGPNLAPASQQFVLQQVMQLLNFDSSAMQIAAAGAPQALPGGQVTGGPIGMPANTPAPAPGGMPAAPLLAGNAANMSQMGVRAPNLPLPQR
jgi:hypothetical protein